MKEDIKLALAVSHSNLFESRHFGDADKYLIYKWNNGKAVLQDEMVNKFQNADEDEQHGSRKKGEAIITLLKKQDVKVLVSRQFGKNIKLVSRSFVPVIVQTETPNEAIEVMEKHIHWIEDELINMTEGYHLFTMKSGILKSGINR